jgi:tRNA-Thr(GGU) m(6)t(6)A37 methyltransferase TsaA
MAALETGRMTIEVVPVGWVESPLTEMARAPMQPDEGAPPAWLVFEAGVADALRDLRPGTEILVLTWLDRADRSVLLTIPRGDPRNPMTGVFSTRSPDRPNPIGLHRVRVIAVDGLRVRVDHLEALDGTPARLWSFSLYETQDGDWPCGVTCRPSPSGRGAGESG